MVFIAFFSFMPIFAKGTLNMSEFLQIDGLWSYIYWCNIIVAAFIVVRVVLNNRNPIKTLAWMMVLLFLPLLGLLLYFFFGRDTKRLKYIGRRSLSQIQQRSHLYYRAQKPVEFPPAYSSLVNYLENTASAYPVQGCQVQVIDDMQLFAEELLAAIRSAREHVHLQFYIFEDDGFGTRVRDALIEKAREGVEVRVIYDSVGSWRVAKDFFEDIRFAGGQVEAFLKVYFPILGNRVNYRNHRKVVVVDGCVGFVGGCNIADRYVQGVEWGAWRDVMLKVCGNGVHGLQTSFLIDWYFANGSLVSGGRYFPSMPVMGDALMQVAQSNPVGVHRVIMSALIMIITSAREYVYMQTPYLMLNDAVKLAIINAALSGVDVRLMIPLRSDSPILTYASYSYLGDLLEAGVRVLLYKEGMMHGKTMVSDDAVSSVGSANLDFRSFYYNFEMSSFVYSSSVARKLKSVFLNDEKGCHQLSVREYSSRSFMRRCAESAARLFSPLL